jgi:site-specific recombinase XerD
MAILDYPAARRQVARATIGPEELEQSRSLEQGFQAHLALCGASARTQKKYAESVRLFARRAGCTLEEAGEDTVGAYLADQRARGIARDTWRGYRFALQAFYRDYLGRDWDLFDKPLRGPERRQVGSEISRADFVAAWRQVREPIHAGALGLCYACGLRISEACAVRIEDFREDGQLLIRGKGAHERLVPVPEKAREYLRAMWLGHKDKEWLFPRRSGGGHVSADVVGETWRQARRLAGIHYPYGTHSLRHAYATRLYEAGIPDEVIRQLLGHADMRTTRTYLHVTAAQRQQVLAVVGM